MILWTFLSWILVSAVNTVNRKKILGLSVWTLHILPVSMRVLYGDMHGVWLTDESRCEYEWFLVSLLTLQQIGDPLLMLLAPSQLVLITFLDKFMTGSADWHRSEDVQTWSVGYGSWPNQKKSSQSSKKAKQNLFQTETHVALRQIIIIIILKILFFNY